jgi:predicted transglutaminase-like cysteine proteinase
VATGVQNKNAYNGMLRGIKARLANNRLGDILLLSGQISPIELREALALQKATRQQLGKVLVQKGHISPCALYYTLAQQFGLRLTAAIFTLFLSFSSAGLCKTARASNIKDVPGQLSLVFEDQPGKIAPVNYYPPLFGYAERRSSNLGPFTKWSGMFDSFHYEMASSSGEQVMREWMDSLSSFKNLPFKTMVHKVNELVNRQEYIEDIKNWDRSDYWANPVEFLKYGGDCEDFAIAKYTALRALGIPEERLRLAIVHDRVKDIPHAVLVVYGDEGPLILDNQVSKVKKAAKVTRYKPIFSINRQAWWLHTSKKKTVVAAAH